MADNITERGFVIGWKAADDDAAPNKLVDALHYNLMANRLKGDSFEFRKATIKAALNAFGTTRFIDWYMAQFTSPYLDDSHLNFLRDTLRFIGGGERQYDLSVWDSIVSRNDIVMSKLEPDTVEHDFFGISSNGVIRTPCSWPTAHVIYRWIAQPNGFADLSYSLSILFGGEYQD